MQWHVIKERIRDVWMCESTEWLERAVALGEYGADLALFYSKRLERFTKERFRAYVSEANDAWEREQAEAAQPSAPPEFEDPQHGASPAKAEPRVRFIRPVETTVSLCPYGRAPSETRCVGCSCEECERS